MHTITEDYLGNMLTGVSKIITEKVHNSGFCTFSEKPLSRTDNLDSIPTSKNWKLFYTTG